jgi:peptide deformylase
MKLVDKSEVEGVICKDILITEISEYEKQIIPDMKRLMQMYDGVGLAAPQVGIKKNFFIFKYGSEVISCYNPIWIPKVNKQSFSKEGCLTYHPRQQNTQLRYKIIYAHFTDSHGIRQKRKLKNRDAIIFQHESDHLIGKTIFFNP